MVKSNSGMLTDVTMGEVETKASKGRDRDLGVDILNMKLEGMMVGEQAARRFALASCLKKATHVKTLSANLSRLGGDSLVDGETEPMILPVRKRIGHKTVRFWLPNASAPTYVFRKRLRIPSEKRKEETCPQPGALAE